jgi:hypothetical protein
MIASQACGPEGGPTYARISFGSKIGEPEDEMTTIPKLVALGLAAALGSPGPPHRIDFSTPGSESQRLNQLLDRELHQRDG